MNPTMPNEWLAGEIAQMVMCINTKGCVLVRTLDAARARQQQESVGEWQLAAGGHFTSWPKCKNPIRRSPRYGSASFTTAFCPLCLSFSSPGYRNARISVCSSLIRPPRLAC